jgi:hypothetical protein
MPVLGQTHAPKASRKMARVKTSAIGPTVSLWWNAEAASGFNVYRGTTAASSCATPPAFVLIGSTASAPTSSSPYVDAGVTFGTNYCYTITAFNTAPPCSVTAPCESAQETPAVFAQTPVNPTPPPPTGLTVGTITAKSVPLQWKAPSAQPGIAVQSYNVLRCHQATCPNPPLAASVTGTKYTDECDYQGGKCWYEITANDLIAGKKVVTGASNIVLAKVQ